MTKAMNTTYTGGCQCGQIRYEIRAEPLTLYLFFLLRRNTVLHYILKTFLGK